MSTLQQPSGQASLSALALIRVSRADEPRKQNSTEWCAGTCSAEERANKPSLPDMRRVTHAELQKKATDKTRGEESLTLDPIVVVLP